MLACGASRAGARCPHPLDSWVEALQQKVGYNTSLSVYPCSALPQAINPGTGKFVEEKQ